MPEATHILQVWPSQKQEVLFRASDGIRLGIRSHQMVIWGDDPNKERSHVFLSDEKAQEYLLGLAQADIDGMLPLHLDNVKLGLYQQPAFLTRYQGPKGLAVIDRQEQEGKVVLSEGSIDMPNFTGVRKMN